jgi:DNA primase
MQIERWIEELGDSQQARDYLSGRGLSSSTIAHFSLGYDSGNHGITIPYRAANQHVITTKLRRLDGGKPKYLTLGHDFPLPAPKRHLFNAQVLLRTGRVIVCEGEFDCMVLHQESLAAVSIPGVSAFEDAWLHLFAGVDVSLAFDGDDPGREAAAKLSGKFDQARIPNHIVHLPEGKDITDLHLAGRLSEYLTDSVKGSLK